MKIEKRDGITVLSLDQRMDAIMAPKMKEAVKELARETGLKLVIDMGKTDLIDSTGCGSLVASLKAVVKNKGDIKLARPNPGPLSILKLTRLDRVFDIHSDLENAVKAFS